MRERIFKSGLDARKFGAGIKRGLADKFMDIDRRVAILECNLVRAAHIIDLEPHIFDERQGF